ncbi:hypothetical protein [Burkholderia stabilis]|uniref:hypothetical protein n=1 Tax=Burkholderia stabilis TaxID=95485 RepID=UPI001F41F58A|nr:hypothetical protein [Burkholderia stabilis]
MKAPVNETLVMDIAGHVAVVVTDVAAVAEVLVRLDFAWHSDRWERTIVDDDDRRSLSRLSSSMRCSPQAGTGARKRSSSITERSVSFGAGTVRLRGAARSNTSSSSIDAISRCG